MVDKTKERARSLIPTDRQRKGSKSGTTKGSDQLLPGRYVHTKEEKQG